MGGFAGLASLGRLAGVNFRRILWRSFPVLLLALISLPVLSAGILIFCYAESKTEVRRIVEAIPADELNIPTVAVLVPARLDGRFYANAWTARQIIWPIDEKYNRVGNTASWHLRNLAETLMVPLQTDERERAAFVWGKTGFVKGRGLRFGAEKYFGKKPEELSEGEIVRLWVIARAPTLYGRNPAEDEEFVAWALRIWRGEEKAGARIKSRNSGG